MLHIFFLHCIVIVIPFKVYVCRHMTILQFVLVGSQKKSAALTLIIIFNRVNATLHVTLSVGRSVGWLVGWSVA